MLPFDFSNISRKFQKVRKISMYRSLHANVTSIKKYNYVSISFHVRPQTVNHSVPAAAPHTIRNARKRAAMWWKRVEIVPDPPQHRARHHRQM